MINKVIIKLKASGDLKCNYNYGSVMHGVLMELISSDYAEKLHISAVHPYSQYVKKADNEIHWVIATLNSEARENIIDPLLSDQINSITLNSKDITFPVESKELFSISYDELFNKNYVSENTYRYIETEFITPASFKADGKYLIFPSAKLVFKNLIRKYDSASGTTEIYDDNLIEQLERNTDIIEYNLRSVKYSLEGVKIPAFIGKITFRISGSPEFIRLMNMLLEFGEYSGTGIKTAMGMGAYRITDKRGAI